MPLKKLFIIGTLLSLALLIGQGPAPAREKNAIYYSKQGWEHYKRGDVYRAIFSFKNALHKNPRYKDALIGLGKSYLEVEAYDQSYDLFKRALKLDDRSSEAMVGIGKTLTGMGNYRGALEYFNKAVEITEEDLDAKYGIANLYRMMGKIIWAKRNLENILRVNPYHFDSLLLMADIKSDEKRFNEARDYIDKAIESDPESPRGYSKYGEIMFRKYLKTENGDDLDEAVEALKNALSIQPKHYRANRIMGYISLELKDYERAAEYFQNSLHENTGVYGLYSLAHAQDMAGNTAGALKNFLDAYKKASADSVLQSRLEDFLVFRDFPMGHPVRVMLNNEHQSLAESRARKHLADQVIMHLRRAVLLNPMNREARESLMDYWRVQGYYRFYVDELKELLRLYPGNEYRDRLNVAVIKRRDRLYHREGYSAEDIPRDVPRVLVMDFDTGGEIIPHPDAGAVFASSLSFVLGQFGRMSPVGMRKRNETARGLRTGMDHLEGSLERVSAMVDAGEIQPVDYVVYGTCHEGGSHISVHCSLLDFHKGFIIGEFDLSESGKEALPRLALRSAKRIYDMMPFRGSILKLKEKGIVVNMGLFDGIGLDDKLVIYKFKSAFPAGSGDKRKIVFTVREADTLVSYAEPPREAELDLVDSSDTVFPLEKRRAKLIK